MLTPMANYADRLRQVREDIGLSKIEMARRIGMSKQAYGDLEAGRSKSLTAENTYKWEKITGYSGRWLVTGMGQKHVNPERDAQIERILEGLARLNPAHREKVEKDIEFFLAQQDPK